MSEIRSIDIEELGLTIQRGLAGVEVEIANLTMVVDNLRKTVDKINDEVRWNNYDR